MWSRWTSVQPYPTVIIALPLYFCQEIICHCVMKWRTTMNPKSREQISATNIDSSTTESFFSPPPLQTVGATQCPWTIIFHGNRLETKTDLVFRVLEGDERSTANPWLPYSTRYCYRYKPDSDFPFLCLVVIPYCD